MFEGGWGMSELRAAGEAGGPGESVAGAGAVGTGVDVVAEIERLRSNVVELARLFEDLRAKHNAHSHAGAVASPLGAGKRVVEFVVLCRGNLIHQGGTPSQLTAAQWHNGIVAYLAQVNSPVTLVDPSGATWTVVPEEMEDRHSPLGGQFLLE